MLLVTATTTIIDARVLDAIMMGLSPRQKSASALWLRWGLSLLCQDGQGRNKRERQSCGKGITGHLYSNQQGSLGEAVDCRLSQHREETSGVYLLWVSVYAALSR